MPLIKVNKLSKSSKSSMKERVISSIFIASFFIFLFVFAIMADNTNNWSPIKSLLGRQIFGWILLVYLLPFLVISIKEICNIFFKFNIYAFILVGISTVILVYAPTMLYFLKYYNYIDIPLGENILDIKTLTNIFSIVLALAILLVVLINTVLLIVTFELTFKNWFILNLLVGLSSGFFLSLFFFVFTRGWLVLLWLIVVVVSSDSFAYFGGVLFGKHKMCPKISPKKTWEGFAIGQVLTVGLSLLLLYLFSFIKHNPYVLNQIMGIQILKINETLGDSLYMSWSTWWIVMFFVTIILSLLSVFGDLAFSWFKRKYHIKDYGYLIPGHGGIIDRIDSHSVVISFYFVLSFFIALFANTIVFH